ncbi:MAG: hypothetical protein GX051_08060 [Clostridiales bacterium]|nr:hypothetical protein [Clostridiales bacterium]
MKALRKTIAVLCAAALLISVASIGASAAEVDYVINNPYADVNWQTYSQYKADLHSHTTASDGSDTLKEMTEAHYDAGFDIVAVTDHGVVDYGWSEQKVIPALKVFVTLKDRDGIIEALDENGGTTAAGKSYSLITENGSDYYQQSNSDGSAAGQLMMRVPFGIENNPSSLNNAHVNSWFADYGHAIMGGTSDYITPISNVDALGGLSVINHPGEYTNARDEIYTEDAYNMEDSTYAYKINKFAGLLTDYDSCIGIDINSKGDSRTRFDRKLWDILLQKVVPTGRNVFAIATSDAHKTSVVYTAGYTLMCMESNTVENLRACMETGAFFAGSKSLGNYDEIKEIADILSVSGNKTESAMGNKLTELYKQVEVQHAAGEQGAKYEAPLDVAAPTVNGVAVDEKADTITLSTTDGMLVRWIADGKLIATGNSIDLDDYSDKIGSYVRAEVFGEGGIVYTQPFTLEYKGAPAEQDNSYMDLWFIASFIPDSIVKFLAAFEIFETIWGFMS